MKLRMWLNYDFGYMNRSVVFDTACISSTLIVIFRMPANFESHSIHSVVSKYLNYSSLNPFFSTQYWRHFSPYWSHDWSTLNEVRWKMESDEFETETKPEHVRNIYSNHKDTDNNYAFILLFYLIQDKTITSHPSGQRCSFILILLVIVAI